MFMCQNALHLFYILKNVSCKINIQVAVKNLVLEKENSKDKEENDEIGNKTLAIHHNQKISLWN